MTNTTGLLWSGKLAMLRAMRAGLEVAPINQDKAGQFGFANCGVAVNATTLHLLLDAVAARDSIEVTAIISGGRILLTAIDGWQA